MSTALVVGLCVAIYALAVLGAGWLWGTAMAAPWVWVLLAKNYARTRRDESGRE